MLTTILLIIIYLAFVSLGVPDGVMGVAWPEMRQTFHVSLESAGYLTAMGTIGSVFSAMMSGHILKRFGTGKVVCVSCALTGLSFLGFYFSGSFYFLMLLAVPLGLGAGAVDTGLNDYVARHFSSRHMNWLHACWGLGAFAGPMLMTRAIVDTGSWRNGYLAVSLIQLSLSLLFLFSLPLWKRHQKMKAANIEAADPSIAKTPDATGGKLTIAKRLRRSFLYIAQKKGLLSGMLLFLFYVGSETSVGIWSASYLRTARAVSIEDAGVWVSMFYGSITVGRIIAGFFVEKIGTKKSIWIGICVSIVGFISLSVPAATNILCPLGLILIGLGFAPVYPCTMQDAPKFFGSFSVIAIGYEMGFANIGYAFLPMAVGAISGATNLYAVPLIAFVFLVGFAVSYAKLSKIRSED